jgi:transcriptional repressor NrdR
MLSGVIRACEKRPVSVEKMEDIVTQVERAIQKKSDREVLSSRIGELVMDKLKLIDDVAYVRFASVYRQFKDVGQFMVELKDILGKDKKKK